MPLPEPTPNEEHAAFLGRCMSDAQALADFPGRAQRFAVCRRQLEKGIDRSRLRYRMAKQFRDNVDRRAVPMARALERFFARLARQEIRDLLRRPDLAGVVKSIEPVSISKLGPKDELALLEILRVFGLRSFESEGSRVVADFGGPGAKWIVSPQAESEFMSAKEIRVKEILDGTRAELDQKFREVLTAAQGTIPRPTMGELSRQLREATGVTFLEVGEEQRAGAFGPARAARIARTETAQAQNAGIQEGYRIVGVEEIEWITILDGRERPEHNEMHGVRTRVGVPFTLSDGTVLRYPADPTGPPGQIINCRCTTAPV